MNPRDQTIFALSSGRPPSAIAVVRISGPVAGKALAALAGKLPEPRRATRALLRDGAGESIDDAIVLWFPRPSSATGEDVAELHVHGGRAVLMSLFSALSAMANVRAADAGEFTRRAFENGKLDLTKAEGLDDLIHADTERQRIQALRQLKGLLGDKAREWRREIIEAQAMLEAGIDFSDEGDVPAELVGPARARIQSLRAEIDEALAAESRSERLRDGLVVAIAGPPNVGKSTLMNQLARRDVAIVSPHAGTTRDIIEVQLDLDGYPVTVIDTAGIRDSNDPIEMEGVRRARARAVGADLVLWLSDSSHDEPSFESSGPVWRVRNKIDLEETGPRRGPAAVACDTQFAFLFRISATRGDGVAELVAALVGFAEAYFASGVSGLITRARQRELLRETADSLRRSLDVIIDGEELAAEELRRASYSLGRLLGRVDVEDILGAIFSEFCIGK